VYAQPDRRQIDGRDIDDSDLIWRWWLLRGHRRIVPATSLLHVR
jgi:hypothetical protein